MEYQAARETADVSMNRVIRSSSAYALPPSVWPGEVLLGEVHVQQGFSRGGPPSIGLSIDVVHVDRQGRAQLQAGRVLAQVPAVRVTTRRGDLRFVMRQPLPRALVRTGLVPAPEGLSDEDYAVWTRSPEELVPDVVVDDCEFSIDGVRHAGERAVRGAVSLCRLRVAQDLVVDVAVSGSAPERRELVEVGDLTGLARLSSILEAALSARPRGTA